MSTRKKLRELEVETLKSDIDWLKSHDDALEQFGSDDHTKQVILKARSNRIGWLFEHLFEYLEESDRCAYGGEDVLSVD